MTTAVSSGFKIKPIIIWILRILMGAAFIAAAAMKLSGQPMMIEEFEHIGLGQWFRYFTGVLELIGGVAILVPSVSLLGAGLLLLIDLGAFVAQVVVLHVDWIHTIIIAVLLGLLIYLQRDSIKARRALD